MFRTCCLVTAAVLTLVGTGRADSDTAIAPNQMGPEVGKAPSLAPDPLPSRIVSTDGGAATSADAPAAENAPATPPAADGAAPAGPQTVTSVPGPGCGPQGCGGCAARPGCVERFWAWLTYHPCYRPCAVGCCHQCVPACNPPLYTFFPCYGCSYIDYNRAACPGCGCDGRNRSVHLFGLWHFGQ